MGSLLSSKREPIKHIDDFYTAEELIEYIGPPQKTIRKKNSTNILIWEEIIARVRIPSDTIIDIRDNN